MAQQNNPAAEETDEGTSLEKEIERLDKDDPEYAAKREKLTERLREFKTELDKTHKKIRKQQQETHAALKLLRRQARENPRNEELQHLLAGAELDKSFLTRAVAEIVSAKGNLQQEMGRLKSSHDFKQPLDIKIVTDIKVRPLPSSHTSERREQTRSAVKTATIQRRNQRMPLGKKILMLRQTTAERTTASRTPPKQNTRQS